MVARGSYVYSEVSEVKTVRSDTSSNGCSHDFFSHCFLRSLPLRMRGKLIRKKIYLIRGRVLVIETLNSRGSEDYVGPCRYNDLHSENKKPSILEIFLEHACLTGFSFPSTNFIAELARRPRTISKHPHAGLMSLLIPSTDTASQFTVSSSTAFYRVL